MSDWEVRVMDAQRERVETLCRHRVDMESLYEPYGRGGRKDKMDVRCRDCGMVAHIVLDPELLGDCADGLWQPEAQQ